MPKSYPLTPWDSLQLLTKKFSDQQVRMVVEFEGHLDETRLAAAVDTAVAIEPVLGCRVQDRFFRPRWRPVPGTKAGTLLRVIPAADAADAPAEIERLLVEDLDPACGPIVRIGLVRADSDVLVVNLDHTAGDAASVRSLTYLLASLYRDPGRFPAPEPGAYFAMRGFAALEPLMKRPAGRKGRGGPPPASRPRWQFPWRPGVTEFRKTIIVRRLPPAKAAAVRGFAASRKAWLNDIFLAAYFRALGRLVGEGEGRGVPCLTVPVDMRAYIPAADRPRIANFSASFEVTLDEGWGASFEETLALVRAATEKEKQGRPGLGQAAFLTSLADRVPFRIMKGRLEKGKVRMTLPPPWFIALGVLRPESLAFGPVAARHAYSLQSVGRAGAVFQLSASQFGGAITLAVCFAGDDANRDLVGRFLEAYEGELPS